MGTSVIPISVVNGADILRVAVPHVGEQYVFGTDVPKDNPNWRGPWDCAEFVAWAVYQASGILYGCANDDGDPATADAFTGYWDRDAKRFGMVIPIAQAAQTPGAAILRLAVHNGSGGHIVISDGAGGTVEAHSSADGVIRGKLASRRWDYGILVSGINYAAPDINAAAPVFATPATLFHQTERKSVEPIVKRIQKALSAAGYNAGPADGIFGTHTVAAVIAFQSAHGLVPDGEVGTNTAAALHIRLR